MWNKLTHLVKSRGNVDGSRTDGEREERAVTPDVLQASPAEQGSVMSHVYEQHPNLSMFHTGSGANLTSLSPPPSPTKGSKRSIFKRSLKAKLTSTPVGDAKSTATDKDISSPAFSVWTPPSPGKLIPKKIRASLQIDTFVARTTDVPCAPGSEPLPAQHQLLGVPSLHNSQSADKEPADAGGASSVRSILRDPNTPGTGRSVRFFSRDACRVITPNASEGDIVPDSPPDINPMSLLDKLGCVDPEDSTDSPVGNETEYLSALASPPPDVFSSPRQGQSGKPLPFEPRHPPRTHAHVSSLADHSQEDLIASLRGQLQLQRQLAAQFEVDLGARDEIVTLLTTRLQEAEAGAEKYRKEVERRQSVTRALQQKVSELEKLCRGLEQEIDRSREESFERSIMDEASEGALVALHGSIGQLKGELEVVRQERDGLNAKVAALIEAKGAWDEAERGLKDLVETKSAAVQDLEDRLVAMGGIESQDANQTEFEDKIRAKDEEVKMLKAEVEAQWGHAEKADEKLKDLEREKEALSGSVQALQTKIEELDADCNKVETRRAELEEELNDAWASKEEFEHERNQIVEELNAERGHAEELVHMLHEHNTKLEVLEQEHRYANDNVARLEELLLARDDENAKAREQIIEREKETEDLRAEVHKMKREYGRFADEQGRNLDETLQREEASRRQMEDMVKQKAEAEIAVRSMKERLGNVADEADRLRRQVHELQQESADKDIKLLELTKIRARDKEDKESLNIALDSKQQELELLKRKLGVKGTGGSTPAPNRIGVPDSTSRRHSAAFVTPSAPRPKPGSTPGIVKATPSVETPVSRFGRSVSGQSVNHVSSTTKPARSAVTRAVAGQTPLSASTSSLSRSTSSRPRSTLPVSTHRRSSSVMSGASMVLSEDGDKENAPPAKTAKRTSVIPA